MPNRKPILMSLHIVREPGKLGTPRRLIARIPVNVALDGAIGAVPFLGDAFDVMRARIVVI